MKNRKIMNEVLSKEIEKLVRSKANCDLYIKVSDVIEIIELLVKEETGRKHTKCNCYCHLDDAVLFTECYKLHEGWEK